MAVPVREPFQVVGYQHPQGGVENSTPLSTQSGNGCNRFGWFETPTLAELQSGISGVLYDDAVGTTNAGSWTAVAGSSGGVTVAYQLTWGYVLDEAHIDLACLPIDTCNPNQFTFNSGALPGQPTYFNPTPIPYESCSGGSVAYLVVHAVVRAIAT